MAFKMCSSWAIIARAGLNTNTAAQASAAIMEKCSNDAEAVINTSSRYDWTTNWGSLTAVAKPMLSEVASNLGAIYLIAYNMASGSRIEMEDRINILRDASLRGLSLLRDDKTRKFLGKP